MALSWRVSGQFKLIIGIHFKPKVQKKMTKTILANKETSQNVSNICRNLSKCEISDLLKGRKNLKV